MDAGEHQKAKEDMDRAIEMQPERMGPYTNRSLLHRLMSNYEAALEDMEKAVRLGATYLEDDLVELRRKVVYKSSDKNNSG